MGVVVFTCAQQIVAAVAALAVEVFLGWKQTLVWLAVRVACQEFSISIYKL